MADIYEVTLYVTETIEVIADSPDEAYAEAESMADLDTWDYHDVMRVGPSPWEDED
ncbi:hypothetical protein SEA_SPEEDDEMON_1300 [Gordonia phage SpeedDemon]|nr:hypothetical protein SEA_SPEEDDEMON_1300 [Gordonia phage SpeedDemon]